MYEPGPNHRKVSAILAELARPADGERVALGALVQGLGDRAFGILILVFALPNAVGLGTIPGLSTVFGLPQLFVAVQMAAGLTRLWLPAWLTRKTIARADLARISEKSMPYLVRAERVLRPRLLPLTSLAAERLLGLVFVALAGIVSLPIPFGNQPPAVALAVISIGLVERDGLFVAIGLAVAVIAVAIAAAAVAAIAAAAILLIQSVFG